MVGETLALARHDAGLSIAEISIRTSIKPIVIDGIEHEDYSACSGDSEARRDIAAIAQALGVDAAPLVQAFDAARQRAESEWIAATKSSEPMIADKAPEREPAPATATEVTPPFRWGQLSRPATAGDPRGPITTGEASLSARVAVADQHPVIWVALGAALVALAALGGILIIVGAGGQAAKHAVVAGARHRSAPRAAALRRTSPGHSANSPRPTKSASSASSRQVRLLVPATIAAFGPGGTGDGDSPQLARQALGGRLAAPWHSAWYATQHFGNLQSGTGLLLDMGQNVSITSAEIALGKSRGADLALRIGNAPALASMRPVARATNAGGVVRLTTAPARGHYVLVWFTKLPPDQAGTFQVFVYDIELRGYR